MSVFQTIETFDTPNGGRDKINYNFSLIGGGITAVTTGATIVSAGTNITMSSGFTSPAIYHFGMSLSNNISLNSISANTISGGTLFSGSTNLQTLFNTFNSQLITKANLSGATFTGTVLAPGLSATTLSGGTIFSGATNLYNIFQQIGSGTQTIVAPGSNINTGGTATNPIVSLVATPSINGISISGTGLANGFSANTLSGGTIYTGSTNLQTYLDIINGQISTKANLSGATFTGTVLAPGLSATTLSGGTILSGNTNLYSIFQQANTTIQVVGQGSNILTGGTAANPIINTVASPSFNGLTLSGTGLANGFSANTLSGKTIYSGSTDLSLVFQSIFSTAIQGVGTSNFIPLWNGSASLINSSLFQDPNTGVTIFNNLYVTGATTTSTLVVTATTVAPINIPILTADPSTLNDGDLWAVSGSTGNALLKFRIGGSTKSVELS